MARIVVTGSAGLIGGLVFDALRARGDEVFGIDRPHDERISRRRNVDDEGAYSRLDHACDLSQISVADLTECFAGVDAVIHLAADADPSNITQSMLSTNINSTENVLNAALSAGVSRVILASSGLAQITLERYIGTRFEMIGTSHGVGVDTPYGLSKIIGEQLGRAFVEQHEIEIVSVRIGTVIPDDDEHHKRGGRLMATAFLAEDVRQFFLAALDADLTEVGGHLLTAAQSASPTRFIDLEPGVSVLGWSPISWPYPIAHEE